MFTDFYVADRSRAEEISQGSVDPDLSLDGISDFELVALSEVLRDGTPHRPELGCVDEELGSVVVVAEPAFVGALAALASEQLPTVARRWATAEGFAGFSEHDVRQMLSGLQAVAGRASEANLAVLYVTAI